MSKSEEILQKLESIEDKIDDLDERVDVLESRADHLSDFTEDIDADVEDVQKEWNSVKEVIMGTSNKLKLNTAERLMNGADWEDVEYSETINRDRAMTVISKWKTLSTAISGGRRFRVKRIQNTFDDVNNYQTAKRVANQVEKLSDGKIEKRDGKNAGKVLMQESGDENKLIRDLEAIFSE